MTLTEEDMPKCAVVQSTLTMDTQSADSGTMLKQREQEILLQLCDLLRGYGEKILSGQSKLSLTTRSLCILNDSFTSLPGTEELASSFDVVPPNSPKLHLVQDIQFLYDFMQKTLALKILHVSSTLQGRVNLSPFKSLRTLEIKKTPLHLLEGIQRMRGRLSTIICARSLSSLQELFETCGGDLSSPMSWPELRTAVLSFNMIEKLDTSLRLVPRLEVLDLSHNSIKDTDRCLEYLTEVSMLNLGYNKISQIPTFAISARTKLSTLILRNNDLDNLNGVGELTGLGELDVADNCLCSHLTTLLPLRALHRLGFLVLLGNPLSFHADHRLLTALQLSPTAANRITLDGQAISQAELQEAQKKAITLRPARPRSPASGRPLPACTSQSSLEASVDMGPAGGCEAGPGHHGRARHSGRATRRVRQAPISDLDSGCDAESEPPLITPDTSMSSTPAATEHLDVKKHLETMRHQLGPDWLQTLVHSSTIHSRVAAPGLAAAPPSPDGSAAGRAGGTSPMAPGAALTAPGGRPAVGQGGRPRMAQFAIGGLDECEDEVDAPCGFSRELVAPSVDYSPPHPDRPLPPGLQQVDTDRLSDHVTPEPDISDTAAQASVLVKSAEFDTIYGRQPSQTDEVDYGPESEPFIVTLLSDEDTDHLVCVTHRYLLEKDINGDVIEALDLHCLQSANMVVLGTDTRDDRMDAVTECPERRLLKLTFDHIRKDKRVRRYLIEDVDSAEALQELLQPIVDSNQADATMRDQMQCLKCSREFNKQQCSRTIRRHGFAPLTSEVYTTGLQQGDLTEVPLCPFCGSDMLIKGESGQRQQELIQTPAGSFKDPLATSSNYPSPWKRATSPVSYDAGKNQSVVSSLQSTQDTASFHSAMEPSTIMSPKTGSSVVSPQSSQSAFTTADEQSDLSDIQVLALSASSTTTPGGSVGKPALKTLCMSHSASDISLYTQRPQQQGSSSKGFAFEKRTATGVHRNHSGQELGRSSYRKRQDSGGSDILVLSQQPASCGMLVSALPSQDSDITLISNPSQSSITVLDSACCSRETLDQVASGMLPQRGSLEVLREGQDLSDAFREAELSLADSLNNKTLSSMVSSVYEKSILDAWGSTSGATNVDDEDDDDVDDAEEEVSGDDTADGVTMVMGTFDSCGGASTRTSTHNSPITQTQSNFQPARTPAAGLNAGNDVVVRTPPGGRGGVRSRVGEDLGLVRFSHTDFAQIDHRLKLYLMMAVCNHDDEDLLLVNRCALWHYVKGEEMPGLVLISSHLIYFFKVTGPEKVDTPERWLKLLQSYRIGDLCYVNIGLGYQTVRLEFGPDAGCFLLLIRDEVRCKRFTEQFTVHIQRISFSTQSKLEGITKNQVGTLDNIQKQLLDDVESEFTDNEALVRFIMGYQHTGEVTASGEKGLHPVSVVVTSTYLHLVDEDLSWKAPRGGADTETSSGCQFVVTDRQRITNVTHLDTFLSAPLDVNLAFYDEQTSEECAWRVAMETRESLVALVSSVKTLWDEQFGVDLLINHVEEA